MEGLINSAPWYKRLEVLRILMNWSQQEAAEKCGTTKKNYWLWETGKNNPRYNSRRAIASAFGVSIEEIFKS